MTKIEEVIGNEKHPLYGWLKEEYGIKPKWNFHKILIDKKGNVVNSYSSLTKPKSEKLIKIIEEKLKDRTLNMRVIFYTFLSILGISLSVIILMPSLFDINNYKGKIENLFYNKTNNTLKIAGDISLSFYLD